VLDVAPAWEVEDLADYHALVRARLAHVVPVTEPLVLISQIQRSGGTLLLQLLDAHPALHVDPYELKIGHPKKHNWPPLDLAQPERWFPVLYFRGMVERIRRTERTRRPDSGRAVFPFMFSPRLQRAIFDASVAERPVTSERDVLDAYFTSYFNAWLDNHNLYAVPKCAVVGFTPRLAMDAANVAGYFAAYPDGTLISIVRDPRAWFASASKHLPRHYEDLEAALELWRASTDAAMDAASRYGDRVLVLTYEQLVTQPEQTMRRVAERIGISMSPILLRPTFNGLPIRANSSEDVEGEGILPERVDAFRDALDRATLGRISEVVGDRYDRAAALA
jgi:Sulfotransferase family